MTMILNITIKYIIALYIFMVYGFVDIEKENFAGALFYKPLFGEINKASTIEEHP